MTNRLLNNYILNLFQNKYFWNIGWLPAIFVLVYFKFYSTFLLLSVPCCILTLSWFHSRFSCSHSFFLNPDQLTLKLCHHLPSLTVISDAVHLNFNLQMKVMFINQILHPGAFRQLLDCLFLKAITFHPCSKICASGVFEMALTQSLAS